MFKNFKNKIKKNIEVFGLVSLILITAISTSYYNFSKKKSEQTYSNFIDNVYFKKTLTHVVSNLDPKFKKIKHKIKSGETFDKILENYSIEKSEIIKIKNSLNKKVNLNKLNTKQIIQFSLDKTNNKIIINKIFFFLSIFGCIFYYPFKKFEKTYPIKISNFRY